MSLSSWSYLLAFLPATVLAYALCPRRARWAVVLAASYCFLWLSSGWLVLYVALATLVTYGSALWVQGVFRRGEQAAPADETRRQARERRRATKRRARRVMLVGVLADLAVLVALKYGGMLASSLDALRGALGMQPLFGGASAAAMPLGISFYTLMCMGYVIDVYRGKYEACRNLGTVATFVAFFPHLTEGPIGTFDALAPQLRAGRVARGRALTRATYLILWGLFKKLVVADRLNPLVGEVFANHASYQGLVVVLAAVLYTVQLYADFSGVVDVARGSAELMGVSLAPNFRQPFFSHDVNEFWRRWHMTLGAWLKEYVFFPVSLSGATRRVTTWAHAHLRGNAARVASTLLALLAVWSACGIWHGASWKYLVYGLYYFALVFLGMLLEPAFARLASALGQDRRAPLWRGVAVARTCLLVVVGMTLFRADTLADFGQMVASVFAGAGLGPLASGELFAHGCDLLDLRVALAGAAFMLAFDVLQRRPGGVSGLVLDHGTPLRWAAGVGLLCAVVVFGAYGVGYSPVASIYAGF